MDTRKRRTTPTNGLEVWTYYTPDNDFNLDKTAALQFVSEEDAKIFNLKNLQGRWAAIRIDAPKS